MIRFNDPWVLLLFIPLLLLGAWLWRRRRLRPRLRFSSTELLDEVGPTLRTRLLGLPAILLFVAAALLTVALARPQSAWREHRRFTEGIAIMLVLDVSDSMMALDFEPNRLERAKAVVQEFIQGRENDQIGAVIFGRDTFTLCPLTQDYQALRNFVQRINFDLVNGEGTAIGMGLANAVDKLRKSPNKSKVVILLTDGENNAGQIDPIDAAEIARQFDIRVYTIGVGSVGGQVLIPNPSGFGPRYIPIEARLDVEQLTRMAEMTGGRFFHATDGSSLEKIYQQINEMERTEIEVHETHYFDELAAWLMVPALLILLLALGLENTWLRTFP
ncbi:MAG TPA: VWA domain-containing protein [Candidatus Sumerlaeota bacterium]|nr:MAG: von Willebrand factor type A domain protein [candidate division BRC1 bacterium ADurb.BinA292]HOE97899.1 VWA domain-containing protein [Candidatus Sumerlaeota bacterium]HPK03516.1 VWA domain-containing protein [Candidatus Sumerlaeota bacterium]